MEGASFPSVTGDEQRRADRAGFIAELGVQKLRGILLIHEGIVAVCGDNAVDEPLAELRISYLDYIDLNLEQRASFLKSCADESQLCKLKTNYRMYKYSKWYKELQANNPDHLPVTTLLAQQVNGDK